MKKGFLIALFCLFLLHHVGKVLHTIDDEKTSQFAQITSSLFVPKLFHQHWKLFAPDPPAYSFRLMHRWRTDAGWGPWLDEGQIWLDKSYSNRVAYYSKRHRLHIGVGYDLHMTYKDSKGLGGIPFDPEKGVALVAPEDVAQTDAYQHASNYFIASSAIPEGAIQLQFINYYRYHEPREGGESIVSLIVFPKQVLGLDD